MEAELCSEEKPEKPLIDAMMMIQSRSGGVDLGMINDEQSRGGGEEQIVNRRGFEKQSGAIRQEEGGSLGTCAVAVGCHELC